MKENGNSAAFTKEKEKEEKGIKKLNLRERDASLLCYVLGWVSGLFFLFMEKENKLIRFHAMQSVMTFGLITIIFLVFAGIDWIIVLTQAWELPGFFVLLDIIDIIITLLYFVTFILWVLLMYKSYQGDKVKLPVIGDAAEERIEDLT